MGKHLSNIKYLTQKHSSYMQYAKCNIVGELNTSIKLATTLLSSNVNLSETKTFFSFKY